MSEHPPHRHHPRGQIRAVLRREAALFRSSPLLLAAAVMISIVPSLYTYIYVKGIWDPYGNISQLPAGFVTLDEGTEFRGQAYNLGEELAEEMRGGGHFRFTEFASSAEAMAAVERNDVHFALVVPEDFSARALPGTQAATLTLLTASGTSYTAMLIGERFVTEVADRLNEQMGTERWRVVLSSGRDARGAVTQLSEGVDALLAGAQTLSTGASEAHAGARELATNQAALAEGLGEIPAGRLIEGIAGIRAGADALSEGLGAIDTARLTSAEHQIADGQQQVADGLAEIDTRRLVTAGAELQAGSARLAEGVAGSRTMRTLAGVEREELERLAAGAREYQSSIEQLAAGLEQLQAGTRELATGSQTFRERIDELAAGIERAQRGARELAAGAAAYQAGIGELSDGLATATGGAGQLAEGATRLVAGLASLEAGSAALVEGLRRVSEGLHVFRAALPESADGQRPEDLVASVAFRGVDLAPAASNGPAFAPYFMALSMWLGSVVSAFMFHFNVFPRSVERKMRIAKIIGKGLIPGAITLAAAMFLGITIHVFLGVPLVHARGFFTVLLVTAITFDTIVYALMRLLGDAGKMVSVIFLVLQLSAAGGPYPIELSGPFYQTIHGWLPFTYAVRGLRASMFGSYGGDWALQIYHMVPWIAVGILISHWTADRFHYVDDDDYRAAIKVGG